MESCNLINNIRGGVIQDGLAAGISPNDQRSIIITGLIIISVWLAMGTTTGFEIVSTILNECIYMFLLPIIFHFSLRKWLFNTSIQIFPFTIPMCLIFIVNFLVYLNLS